MLEFKIHKNASTVKVCNKLEDSVPKAGNVFYVIDSRVKKLYWFDLPTDRTVTIEANENQKSLESTVEIIDLLHSKGAQRYDMLCGIGGGIVCDLTAFAASVYKRGINLSLVPTTLIAQADAAIGGKTGVNYSGTKNAIGTFYTASEIRIYNGYLSSLEEIEYESGMAEVLKTGILIDPEIIELSHDRRNLSEVVNRCIKAKNKIIEKDFTDRGIRQILNFGHTIGHAIELKRGLRHGIAVAAGMIIESKFMFEKGAMDSTVYKRITGILSSYSDYANKNYYHEITNSLKQDKKLKGSTIYMTTLDALGESKLVEIDSEDLIKWLERRS